MDLRRTDPEDERIQNARTEEFFLVLINRNQLKKMPEFLHNDVVFPSGKGKKECMQWIENELDFIESYRKLNKGFINGKIFDPQFDEKGGVIEFYISTKENAGERAIPLHDFAFPFRKDFDAPRAITLSIKSGLITKIEITYNFVTWQEYLTILKSN